VDGGCRDGGMPHSDTDLIKALCDISSYEQILNRTSLMRVNHHAVSIVEDRT
jgi:hypothetical protein